MGTVTAMDMGMTTVMDTTTNRQSATISCHCEERSDVAISSDQGRSMGIEIATDAFGVLAMTIRAGRTDCNVCSRV